MAGFLVSDDTGAACDGAGNLRAFRREWCEHRDDDTLPVARPLDGGRRGREIYD